jgi:hypothetical protein
MRSGIPLLLLACGPFFGPSLPAVVAAEKPVEPAAKSPSAPDADEEACEVVRFPASPPAIVVYGDTYGRRYGGRPKPQGPHVLVAAWADGHIVWSEDKSWGGPPYLVGEFDKAKLDALVDELAKKGTFRDASLEREYVGPGATYLVVEVSHGKHRLRLASWHELVERRDNVVATAEGVETLADKTRKEALREQPAEYRRFRETWSTLRERLVEWVPPKGRPYAGSPPDVGRRKPRKEEKTNKA